MCNSVRQLAAADVYIGRVAKIPCWKKTSTPFWSGCYGIVGGIGLIKRRIYADLPDRGQFESRVRSAHCQCVTHSAVGNPPIAHKPSDWHSVVKSNMALKTIIHRKYTVDIDRIQICTKDKNRTIIRNKQRHWWAGLITCFAIRPKSIGWQLRNGAWYPQVKTAEIRASDSES